MTDTGDENEGASTSILPDELTYGFVADRVLLAIGDTQGDPDRYPDGLAAVGTVTLRPLKESHYTKNDPATVVQKPVVCTIYQGDDPDDPDYDPQRAGLLVDPAGHVGNVSLVCGRYEAIYRLVRGASPKRVEFTVRPEHTNEKPLWLPGEAEIVEAPFERFIVNERVQSETYDARDAAKQYRDEARTDRQAAQTARTGAETAETNAGTHATAAATSASTAADILEANQAIGITVDDSVGTRIYVGDTMIHGETGWLDVSHLLTEDWTIGVNLGRVRIKRENSTVHLDLRIDRVTEGRARSSNSRFINIPAGFRPASYSNVLGDAELYDLDQVGRVNAMASAGGMLVKDFTGTWEAGDRLFVIAQWEVDRPHVWITELPEATE